MAADSGAWLVRAGLISADQLQVAQTARANHGGCLGEHLVLLGFVDDETLTEFYSAKLRIGRVSQRQLRALTHPILERIPADMAAELRTIPISSDRDSNLTVAMGDPSDQHAIDEIAFFTNSYVVRQVATQADLTWALDHYYGVSTVLADPPPAPPRPSRPTGTGFVNESTVPEGGARGLASVESLSPRQIAEAAGIGQYTVVRDADDPNLAPRSGELKAERPPDDTPVKRLPAVVIDDISLTTTGFAPAADPIEDEPVLLDRRKAGPVAATSNDRAPEPASEDTDSNATWGGGTNPYHGATDPDAGPILTDSEGSEFTDPGEITNPRGDSRKRSIHDSDGGPTLPTKDTIDDMDPLEDGGVTNPDATARLAQDVASEADSDRGSGVVLLDRKKRAPRSPHSTAVGYERHGQVDSRANARQDTGSQPAPAGEHEDEQVSRSRKKASKSSRSNSQKAKREPATTTPATSAPRTVATVDEGWDVDDGWGPPGTTIPPSFLGANPEAVTEDAQSGSIPLAVDEELTGEVLQAENAVSSPIAAPDENTQPVISDQKTNKAATPQLSAAEMATAMEKSSNRLLETVRKIEQAPSRDELVDILLDHLGSTCKRRMFIAVKGGAAVPFKQQGASRPGVVTTELSLSDASTLAQVAQSRLAYHGQLSPNVFQFASRAMDGDPDTDAVVIPVVLGTRVVALLYGDGISGPVFDEHQMVLGRAAGQAIERIVKLAKASRPSITD